MEEAARMERSAEAIAESVAEHAPGLIAEAERELARLQYALALGRRAHTPSGIRWLKRKIAEVERTLEAARAA